MSSLAEFTDNLVGWVSSLPQDLHEKRLHDVSAHLVTLCAQTRVRDGTEEDSGESTVAAEDTLGALVYLCTYLTHWFAQQQQLRQEKRIHSDNTFEAFMSAVYGVTVTHAPRQRYQRRHASSIIGNASLSPLDEMDVCGAFPHYQRAMNSALRAVVGRAASALGPASMAWRQPALVAALTTLAASVADIEKHNHGGDCCRVKHPSRRTHYRGRGYQREGEAKTSEVLPCPLCIAVAMDNELAAEAVWALLALHAAFPDANGAEPRGDPSRRRSRNESSRTRRASWSKTAGAMEAMDAAARISATHIVAVCRQGVLNGALVVPRRALHYWQRPMATRTTASDTITDSDGAHVTERSGGLSISKAATVATIAALWAQDEATMCRDHEDTLASLRALAALAADADHTTDTLKNIDGYALYAVQGDGELKEKDAHSDRSGESDRFLMLVVATPYPWLRARTLLAHFCASGHLSAARWVVRALMLSVRTGVGNTPDTPGASVKAFQPEMPSHPLPPLLTGLNVALNATLSAPATSMPLTTRAALVRLLLLGGASVHALHPAALQHSLPLVEAAGTITRTPRSDEASTATSHAGRTMLELLYSPGSVLDPPVSTAMSNGAAASPPPAQSPPTLLQRLRAAATASTAADRLAHVALRLWVEKLSTHATSKANRSGDVDGDGDGTDSNTTVAAAAMVARAAAQDRVARLALAALGYDPHHTTARLLLAAVLGQRLRAEHQRIQQSRSLTSTNVVNSSVPEATATSTSVTLARLHTALVRGSGAVPLAAAVAARLGLCRLMASQEELRRGGSGGKESNRSADIGNEFEGEPTTQDPVTQPRVLVAAGELAGIWDEVQADLTWLAEDGAAVHRTSLSFPHSPSTGSAHAATTTTVVNDDSKSSADSDPLYLRVALPSSTIVSIANEDIKHCNMYTDVKQSGGPAVWVRVSPDVSVRATLAAGGTAYGVVDTDLPPHAPVQRGDLILFVRAGGQDGKKEKANDDCGGVERNKMERSGDGRSCHSRSEWADLVVLRVVPAAVGATVRAQVVLRSDAMTSASASSSPNARPDHGLRAVTLRCVRALCTATADEYDNSSQVWEPLRWLTVRPFTVCTSTSTTAGDDGGRQVLSTDVIAALQSDRACLRATLATAVQGGGGKLGGLLWARELTTTTALSVHSSDSDTSSCDGSGSDRSSDTDDCEGEEGDGRARHGQSALAMLTDDKVVARREHYLTRSRSCLWRAPAWSEGGWRHTLAVPAFPALSSTLSTTAVAPLLRHAILVVALQTPHETHILSNEVSGVSAEVVGINPAQFGF